MVSRHDNYTNSSQVLLEENVREVCTYSVYNVNFHTRFHGNMPKTQFYMQRKCHVVVL